jgi:site-specific DNA recombinase
MTNQIIRCAIYTRKSSEEGLEQSFNSLAAQREACEAYILSQKHEGWMAIRDVYDDGGISGGTMDRPALKRLLSDIQEGKINTVVVYKVDRLTRSLTDFAKIVEIFDSKSVSFVSVTQQFNTTSSMGRLTLNVLLSFAQFEREVTGERIRDKIAASKKKGIWMGGMVPLGYDCMNRQLVVNQSEANTVREIFRQYVRLGCLTKLKQYLEQNRTLSKIRTSNAGRKYGGATYSRGALHHLLCNRIYLGEIVHRNEHFPGQHDAIVPRQLWDRVACCRKQNDQAHRSAGVRSPSSPLSGLLFDSSGVRFTPTQSRKNGTRYRYYTSQAVIQPNGKKPQIARFPAQELENLVAKLICELLRSPAKLIADIKDGAVRDLVESQIAKLAKAWPQLEHSKVEQVVRNVVSCVTIGHSKVWVDVRKARLLSHLNGPGSGGIDVAFHGKPDLQLHCDFEVLRRSGAIYIVPPNTVSGRGSPIPSIVKAIARSRDWHERIIAGEFATVNQVAEKSDLTKRYVRKILRLGYLSPKVTEALLVGKHSPSLTLKKILHDIPLDWQQQERKIFGYQRTLGRESHCDFG